MNREDMLLWKTELRVRRILTCAFVAFALALLFSVSIVYATPSPVARSIALEFLEKVAGMDADSYTVSSFVASTDSMPGSPHLQTDMKIVVSDTQNEFEVLITLVDDKFWAYRLEILSSELGEGEVSLNECLTVAKEVVDGYRVYFNASYCSGFAEMVSTALQTQSLTLEDESARLEIQYAGNNSTPVEYASVRYFQKITGQFIANFRSVCFSVSKTGLLTRFWDNMALYWVATTDIQVSEEEAINTAMPYIEAYASENKQKIEAVNATFEYVKDIASHRGDNFAMYPRWFVLATFDEVKYGVYGYAVMIWADNGEVYHYGSQGFYSSVNGSDSSLPLWPLAVAVVAIVILFGLIVYTQRHAKASRVESRGESGE